MTIKAILFDKDGTLFHFNETWGPWFYDVLFELSDGKHDLLLELANLLKYDYKTKTFYKNSPFIAGTEGETIRIMLSLLPNFEEENLIKWLSKKSMSVDGKPVDNLLETLEQIQEKNIIMGVATNDSVSSAHNQLEENNIKRFFGYIYGFDSGFGFKPGTGMQKEFLRETSLLANEVIMVGDSMADIESGNKIGMTRVAVLTGPLGRSELEKKADIVLNSISEIPSLLQKL